MIKRKLISGLKSHLSRKEISFIVGPRQAGKTTLMLFLKDYLDKKGAKTLFLNLDIESDRQFFSSQSDLIKKIQLEIGSERGFVFIDEIQRKEDAGIFLKGIYDMNLPYKFLISGSGSVELKEKIHESLLGRKRMFPLSTLSFEEFVNFKTNYRYENKLREFFALDQYKTKELLQEYLNFGGYPRVVLENLREEKRKLINEIYQSYLERDISYLLKVRKTENFTNLFKILAGQVGNLFNAAEVSRTLGTSQKTLKDYIWYLQKTFIVNKVTPYYRNIRKEITKSPVFYFYDLGLRNFALGAFGNLVNAYEMGSVFENFVFNLLKDQFQNSSTEIHFWRTKEGAEVDFVIDNGRVPFPVEVKYRKLKNPEISRSFRSFAHKYKPQRGYIVNLGLEKDMALGKTKVQFLPFYKLIGGKIK
ncbi:MAG: ATP-binding protein [Candidatus Aminicenantaceae bacterium]